MTGLCQAKVAPGEERVGRLVTNVYLGVWGSVLHLASQTQAPLDSAVPGRIQNRRYCQYSHIEDTEPGFELKLIQSERDSPSVCRCCLDLWPLEGIRVLLSLDLMAGDNLGVGFRYEDIRDLCQKAIIGNPGPRAENRNKNTALKAAVTGSGASNEFRKKTRRNIFKYSMFLLFVSQDNQNSSSFNT